MLEDRLDTAVELRWLAAELSLIADWMVCESDE